MQQGTTKFASEARLVVAKDTKSRQNLIYIEVRVETLKEDFREDLEYPSTSRALVPETFLFRHSTGQENPLALTDSLLNHYIHSSTFSRCFL